MRRLSQLALALSLSVLVAGCQLALPGGGPKTGDSEGVTANAITGEAIETTALDAPPPAEATGPASPQPSPVPAEAVAEAEDEAEPATPAPAPDLAAEDAGPATPKSERQKACERKGGTWASTGKGNLRTCVYPTRDAGKQCTRESQCEGVCLARSGTCSPVKPLLGCNEILQDNGARVTLCIE